MPLRPVLHFRSIPDKRFITSSRLQLSHHWSRVDQSALFFSQVFLVTAPPPLAGPLDHCSSDRIEMNVTNQFQKRASPIAHDRLVAPLKQMPPTVVDIVKGPHVAGEQRLQNARRREPIDFQQTSGSGSTSRHKRRA